MWFCPCCEPPVLQLLFLQHMQCKKQGNYKKTSLSFVLHLTTYVLYKRRIVKDLFRGHIGRGHGILWFLSIKQKYRKQMK
jgi:hypothetical protein